MRARKNALLLCILADRHATFHLREEWLERIPHKCSVSGGVKYLFTGLSSLKRRYAVEQTALIQGFRKGSVSDWLHVSQLFPQTMPCGVQPSFDRSDWASEVITHLLQGLSLKVESGQRIPGEIFQPADPSPQLFSPFGIEHPLPRLRGLA